MPGEDPPVRLGWLTGDNARVYRNGPLWSADVGQADWIAGRLTPWDSRTVTMVVPDGFAAYARVLHPAETPGSAGSGGRGNRLVRWAEVAEWSGMPLRSNAQFHSVALPPTDPGEPPPYEGGPGEGSLWLPDAEVLAAIARAWTATPEDCWFCVWDGFGWDSATSVAAVSTAGEPPDNIRWPSPDPVPPVVRDGPRVRLPNRDYLLYRGPVEAIVAPANLAGTREQCANLCWPADRAWCVASEIDLMWTYVGGPRGLIGAVLADNRIEALPAAPGDPVSRVENWVTLWADELADGLLARGEASLSTPRGSVQAWLRHGELRTRTTGARGDWNGSRGYLSLRAGAELRREVTHYLTYAVLDLAVM
jgi:hypothetical protein